MAPRGRTTLAVIVERDGAPAPGVGVWIAPADEWPMLQCLDLNVRPPPSAAFLVTDSAGVAAFPDLAPEMFTVGLDTSSAHARPTRFVTQELEAGYRFVVALGSAVVHGRVHDALGEPRAGVGVQAVNHQANAQYLYIAAFTRTDAHGEYRIEDLPADTTLVVMDSDGRFDGRGDVQQQVIELASWEVRELDFGSPLGTPRWSGFVRNALGEPFPGTGILKLERELDGLFASTPIGDDGAFEIAAAPGVWQLVVHAAGSPGSGFELGEIELPDRDLVRDVVVPGARLTGRVLTRAGEPVRADPAGWLTISVRPLGHDYPAAFRHADLEADGLFRLDGLQAGRWVVGVHPGALAQGETTEVTIAEGDALVVLDLVLDR
jgi:hypothetical protein